LGGDLGIGALSQRAHGLFALPLDRKDFLRRSLSRKSNELEESEVRSAHSTQTMNRVRFTVLALQLPGLSPTRLFSLKKPMVTNTFLE
jgi:hypothetical protein